jgi:hypothetical protein
MDSDQLVIGLSRIGFGVLKPAEFHYVLDLC